ncbi:hypothetical protein CRENBAI_012237 [Crenichthys baileyi]|uniref:Uncharacterized protein n=1 Tax=Crenichthys baileyi TaxID=28760 RepID=A0AAV9S7D2_9TELE
MAWCSLQAQHKGLPPPLHHTRAMHTPGMNLGGDKALVARAVCECTDPNSGFFLHLAVQEWQQMLQVCGSKHMKEQSPWGPGSGTGFNHTEWNRLGTPSHVLNT